jgi:hypothetical protein
MNLETRRTPEELRVALRKQHDELARALDANLIAFSSGVLGALVDIDAAYNRAFAELEAQRQHEVSRG